jgi:uncharacterized protein with HEPN domain
MARGDKAWVGDIIAGTRTRIVHEYFRANTPQTRDIVTDDINPSDEGVRTSNNRPPPET